ncbi:MAG TPA: ATP-binding protein [Candidatus Polarisedimenticolia bacterium]|nr:ATP-binding protein [Candidatus Polarisedimenticolia bacterium]
MFGFIQRSIRFRVMFLIILASFVALLFAANALVLYDASAYKKYWTDDMMTQASLVGRASAPALAFDDSAAAIKNLALLSVRPRVLAATIYTREGSVFAGYTRPGGGANPVPATPGPDGYAIERGRGVLTQGIFDATGRLGTIRIEGKYEIARRLKTYLAIMGAVMIASLLIAVVLSYRLQGSVTKPLLAITEVSHKVKARRDYSLRVRKTTHDEIGELVDTFNDMLGEVGEREQALRTADRRKDEFLATLAHELRNPLAPLRNALEILRRTPDDAKATGMARDIMDRQLRQLVRLVDDLLDVSRITTGKLTLQRDRAELRTIVDGALDMARPHLEAKQIRFLQTLPAEPVILDVDSTRLCQVILNLLHNAAKFTEAGGEVRLTAEARDDFLTLVVTDTGMGIPKEKLPEIFEMFAQLDRSLDRAHAGLGVGLSLAKRIVELHGGTLAATSEGKGRGTSFIVRLPLARESGGRNPAAADAGNGERASGHRILVVDDNEDFVETFGLLLSGMGHEVHAAHEGLEALRMAADVRPDVAFLDIGLPKLDGYALARKIRELPDSKTIVLVAVTGWGQDRDKRLAQEAGFDHHMVKPVETAKVEAILASVPRGR